jgi:hypothetical protein
MNAHSVKTLVTALILSLACAACTTPEHEAGLASEQAGIARAAANYNEQRAGCAAVRPDWQPACELQARADFAQARADAGTGVSHFWPLVWPNYWPVDWRP